MREFLWRVRYAFWMWWIAVPPSDAWHLANAAECELEVSPRDAVFEELSYWDNDE